jgi:hypothetical protein
MFVEDKAIPEVVVPPQWSTEWIDALRSGKYRQCIGAYRQRGWFGRDKLCALAVLDQVSGNRCTELLSPMVMGRIKCMNDIQELSFSQIADWIEQCGLH